MKRTVAELSDPMRDALASGHSSNAGTAKALVRRGLVCTVWWSLPGYHKLPLTPLGRDYQRLIRRVRRLERAEAEGPS